MIFVNNLINNKLRMLLICVDNKYKNGIKLIHFLISINLLYKGNINVILLKIVKQVQRKAETFEITVYNNGKRLKRAEIEKDRMIIHRHEFYNLSLEIT